MQLISIAYTLIFSLSFCALILLLFTLSHHHTPTLLTPRCTNRPLEARLMGMGPGAWNWVKGVMGWSYLDMIKGIPGTGTRNGGLSGPFLKINLDGIIFLRYHSFCLKVTSILTLLSLLFVLPLNLTSSCTSNSQDPTACPQTDYDATTVANLPSRDTELDGGGWAELHVRPFLYCGVVYVTLIIVCRLLWMEWTACLKLRRKWYLEEDHYGRGRGRERDTENMGECEEQRLLNKARNNMPWLTDPEKSDTAPSVELYSVLIGNLPLKPAEILSSATSPDTETDKGDIYHIINTIPTTEWQLAVTAAMFDRAIPGEEWYTSSVAAVSIMPDATCLAKSWRKWYSSIGAQRRLKYVRGILAERGYQDTDGLKEMDNRHLTDPFTAIPWHGKSQTAMYGRELSQSSAMCCPLGCSEDKIKGWATEDLIDLESELLETVLMASHSLRRTQNTTIAKQNNARERKQSKRVSKPDAEKIKRKEAKKTKKMSDELNLATVFDRKETDAVHIHGHGGGERKEGGRHGRTHTMTNLGSTIKPTPYKHRQTLSQAPQTDSTLYQPHLHINSLFPNPNTSAPSSPPATSTSPSDAWRANPHAHSPFHLSPNHPRPSVVLKDQMRHFNDTLGLDVGASPSSVERGQPTIEVELSPINPPSDQEKEFNSPPTKKKLFSFPSPPLPPSPDKITVSGNIIYHPDARGTIKIDLPDEYLPSSEILRTSAPNLNTPPSPNRRRSRTSEFVGIRRRRSNTTISNPRSSVSTIGGGRAAKRSSIYILPSPKNYSKITKANNVTSPMSQNSPFDPPPIGLKGSEVLNDIQITERNVIASMMAKEETGGAEENNRLRLLSNDSMVSDKNYASDDDGGSEDPVIKIDRPPAVFSLTRDGILLAKPNNTLRGGEEAVNEEDDNEDNDHAEHGRWGDWDMGTVVKDATISWCACVKNGLISAMDFVCTRRFGFRGKFKKLVSEDFLVNGGSFAVVTFTSRQAAVAARNCKIDGRGSSRWFTQQGLPVTPLSDAAPFDLKTCRNCCRPVTLSLNVRQKKLRMYVGYFCLFIVYTLYTIPIAKVAELTTANYDSWSKWLYGNWTPPSFVENILLGFVPALLQSIFFSVAPYLFKLISNFGSGSASLNEAERHTLKYYWGFMLLTCFTGSFLATITLNLFNFGETGDLFNDTTAKEVLEKIASDLPITSSAVWLNWILVRSFIVIPLQYLFQFNTHLFKLIRWKCCMRCSQGGGMGGPTPFRLYVDSSVVLLCALTFTVVSPLVLPCTFIYFLITTPIWRRQLVLVYRPMFDAGGMRWPFLFTVVMSAMYLSIILVSLVLLLKNMYTPGILTVLALIPAIDFHRSCVKRFKGAYSDIGLMQAGLINESNKKRGIMISGSFDENHYKEKEDFRKWLVDAHLSAFIPICMLDNQTLVEALTAAPAQTIMTEKMLGEGIDLKEGTTGIGEDGTNSTDRDIDLDYTMDYDSEASVATSRSDYDIEAQEEEIKGDRAKIHRRRQTLKDSILRGVSPKTARKKALAKGEKMEKKEGRERRRSVKKWLMTSDKEKGSESDEEQNKKNLSMIARGWEEEKKRYKRDSLLRGQSE